MNSLVTKRDPSDKVFLKNQPKKKRKDIFEKSAPPPKKERFRKEPSLHLNLLKKIIENSNKMYGKFHIFQVSLNQNDSQSIEKTSIFLKSKDIYLVEYNVIFSREIKLFHSSAML